VTDEIDAIVLVGGQGSRLRPLTLSTPKPMLPAAGVPFLSHLFSRIRAAGITHVVLGTAYRADVFEGYFGNGRALGLDLEYVVEDVPLGTGGAIGNVAGKLRGNTTLVFNGDILSGVEIDKLLYTHTASEADVTLHLTRVPDPRAFGCVSTDSNGRVTAFLEKHPQPTTDQINAGTYVFSRAVVDAIPSGRPVSVERETFPQLLAGGVRVVGHVDATYWRDLGTPADYVAGSADLVTGIAPSEALPGPTGDALWLDGAWADADAAVAGGTVVGRNCVIERGAVVDASILFDGCRISADATVRRSVIGRDAVIGAGATIVDAVIGDRSHIGRGNELVGGARVWPDTSLDDGQIRFSAGGG
jgi:mannose-1-phosphate guanylyltransferase